MSVIQDEAIQKLEQNAGKMNVRVLCTILQNLFMCEKRPVQHELKQMRKAGLIEVNGKTVKLV